MFHSYLIKNKIFKIFPQNKFYFHSVYSLFIPINIYLRCLFAYMFPIYTNGNIKSLRKDLQLEMLFSHDHPINPFTLFFLELEKSYFSSADFWDFCVYHSGTLM